jgi:hypothetical protein
MLLMSTVQAEVTSFRPGNLLQWLNNVFGFNLIDSSTALPEFLTFLFILGVAYLLYKKAIK